MRVSDVLVFISRDPLVAGFVLLWLFGMACLILAGLRLAFHVSREEQAEDARRRHLDALMHLSESKPQRRAIRTGGLADELVSASVRDRARRDGRARVVA